MQRFAALLFCLTLASPAAAQQKEPIGPFAIDVRGAFGRHKAEPSVATDLDVTATNLPTRTFGLVGGAHVYPLRSRRVTLGIGGNFVSTRGSRSVVIETANTPEPVRGPVIRRRFVTFSPEISLNFGHRRGWTQRLFHGPLQSPSR